MTDRIAALLLILLGIMVASMSRGNAGLLLQFRRLPIWFRIPTLVSVCLVCAVILAGLGVAIGWLPR